MLYSIPWALSEAGSSFLYKGVEGMSLLPLPGGGSLCFFFFSKDDLIILLECFPIQ